MDPFLFLLLFLQINNRVPDQLDDRPDLRLRSLLLHTFQFLLGRPIRLVLGRFDRRLFLIRNLRGFFAHSLVFSFSRAHFGLVRLLARFQH